MKRFIQTLQQERLDYFVVFGEQHMHHLVSEMVANDREERPRQGKENELLIRTPSKPKARKKSMSPPEVMRIGENGCRERLGGLLKHYCRRAA